MGRDPLILKKLMFRNSQLVRDEDQRIFVTMPSTYGHHSLARVPFASAADLCPEQHTTGNKDIFKM